MLPVINPNFETKELNITEAEYHGIKDAVHSSTLKHMIKSPHAYYRSLFFPRPATPAVNFGSLAHKAILEGKHFLEDYIVEPVFSGYTKDGVYTTSANATSVKAAKQQWYASLRPEQKVVTQSDYDELGFMMDSLVNHKFVREVFKDGKTEVRGQYKHKTDIGVAFANDFLSFDAETWVDLKTTTDSSHDAFRKSIEKFRYDLQFAIYDEGNEKVFGKRAKFPVWIAIENQEPFECRVHFVDDFYKQTGQYEFNRCMSELKRCLTENEWPQAQAQIESVEPTSWFRYYYDLRIGD